MKLRATFLIDYDLSECVKDGVTLESVRLQLEEAIQNDAGPFESLLDNYPFEVKVETVA